jgi:hypothetical protein
MAIVRQNWNAPFSKEAEHFRVINHSLNMQSGSDLGMSTDREN